MRHLPSLGTSCVLGLALVCHAQAAFAGKLDRAGSQARGESHSSNSSRQSSSSDSSSDSSSSSWGSSGDGGEVDPTAIMLLVGYGLYGIFLGVTSPWWAPNSLLEAGRPVEAARAIRFADYPYADGGHGLLLVPPSPGDESDGIARGATVDAAPPRRVQLSAAQLAVESGIGVNDGVLRFGFRARVQFPLRLQLDSDWSLFREHDREGVDVALLGREHLSVRFAESSRAQFYSGIGPQHLCDARGCVHGIDFTWGFEAFPGRPLVVGFEGSIGNLDQAFAPGLRTRLGYLFGPVEASIGWHQRWVGNIGLGGPFVGVGGWF